MARHRHTRNGHDRPVAALAATEASKIDPNLETAEDQSARTLFGDPTLELYCGRD